MERETHLSNAWASLRGRIIYFECEGRLPGLAGWARGKDRKDWRDGKDLGACLAGKQSGMTFRPSRVC